MTSPKLNLWNQGMAWLIQGEHYEICSLAKSEPVHLQIGASKRLLSFASRTCTLHVYFSRKWRACWQIKYFYAPIWSRPILKGFIRSHQSIIVLISPRQFAITDSFLSCSRVQDNRVSGIEKAWTRKQNGRKLGKGRAASFDHYTFLGNCQPTPPLRQHFALSKK